MTKRGRPTLPAKERMKNVSVRFPEPMYLDLRRMSKEQALTIGALIRDVVSLAIAMDMDRMFEERDKKPKRTHRRAR